MDLQKDWRAAMRIALTLGAFCTTPWLAHAAGVTVPSQEAPQPQAAPAQPEAAAPAQSEKPATAVRNPGALVRYDKPVFHNGHRVLWHGAWRGGGGTPIESGRAAATKPAASVASAAAAGNSHDFTILADGADASAMRMATEFAEAMQTEGMHLKALPGQTSAIALDKAVSGDAADLAIVPVDSLADKSAAGWRDRAPYLARLANEPIEVIAPRAIANISQLAGHKVNVEAADGATAASAANVFSRLNIAPILTNERLPDALAHLSQGQTDAVFVIGAVDSKVMSDFGKDGKFHVLAIPYTSAFQPLYCPMRLTSHDQPNLIAGDDKVDTIGVPTALVALDATPNSPRTDKIEPLAYLFVDQFAQRFGSSGSVGWKGVNLAARIGGWPRFPATQAWLEQNKGAPNAALDTFRNMAQTAAAASDGPSGADSDRLYQSLMQVSRAAQ